VSSTQKKLAKITHKIASDFGIRYCSNCKIDRNNKDGMDIVFPGGLRYRWICKECKEKRGNKT